MTHYFAELKPKCELTGRFNRGCYKMDSESLDEIREWTKSLGKKGDQLWIWKQGEYKNHRILTVE